MAKSSTLQESIREAITSCKEDGSKKQISLLLSEKSIAMMDIVLDQFKKVTDGKFATSRNQLVEIAIEQYVQAAADVLFEDHKINIEEFLEGTNGTGKLISDDKESSKLITINRDLVVFPATYDNFQSIFLNRNMWYSVRINEKNIPSIKHVACYVGAPVSGITHYAAVDYIDKWSDGKYVIYFKGTPIQLKNKIRLGNSQINDMRKLRYSTLDKLLSANEVAHLW